MSVSFQCPSCMRNLQFTVGDSPFTVCPYCKGKIIVPSVAMRQGEIKEQQPEHFGLQERKKYKLAQIQTELNAGRTISAIKIFRETFGTSLAGAKEAIEAMQAGHGVDVPLPNSNQPVHQNTQKPNTEPRRGSAVIFWILVSIGVTLYYVFSGE